jgi:hypothetical protein
MAKICYRTKNMRDATLAIVGQANDIIDEYAAQGYELTLRQLYYQFVARDLLPNSQKSYDKLGAIINDARLAGLVDWDAIVDRTRIVKGTSTWDSPRQILRASASSFKLDVWDAQPHYVEAWIEKDALVGVIAGVCNRHRINFFSCRGYTSQSAMWRAAERMIRQGYGHTCHVLHLGDHDPSGMDMTRDIEDRFRLFGASVQVHRIALNMDQVEAYGPPPNPAKLSDSRCEAYIDEYGDDSWELDALEPSVLEELVESNVLSLRDDDMWNEGIEEEEKLRDGISRISANFDECLEFLKAQD